MQGWPIALSGKDMAGAPRRCQGLLVRICGPRAVDLPLKNTTVQLFGGNMGYMSVKD